MAKDVTGQQLDPRQGSGVTTITRETQVEGQVTGSRPVRLEGSLKGRVELKAALEIVEGATLEAEVQASVVRVAGNVVGNISASELVELLASANVTGDITTPALHVVEGARLDGRVIMRVEGSPAKPPR